MGDISRYKGGARVKPGRGKQSASPTQQSRTDAREAMTRAANPQSQPTEPRQERRALNLDSGTFSEQIPPEYTERSREAIRPRTRAGNWDIEVEGNGLRARRKFKAGGQIKPTEYVEFGPRGKRRVSASEVEQAARRRPK